MTPADDLLTRAHLSTIDLKDLQVHKDIYVALTRKLPNVPESTHSPPLHLITYGVRSIIQPTVLESEIPYLLDLLVQVDLFRQRAEQQARDALEWNKYHLRRPTPAVEVLTDEERLRVEEIADAARGKALRAEMRKAALGYCALDIYNLWTSENSYLLPQRLKAYFPPESLSRDASASSLISNSASTSSASAPTAKPSPQSLFRHQMSQEEEDLNECRAARVRNTQFFAKVSAWQDEQEDNGLLDDSIEYQPAFRAAFPPPADPDELARATEKYLVQVERMVFVLVNMFQENG